MDEVCAQSEMSMRSQTASSAFPLQSVVADVDVYVVVVMVADVVVVVVVVLDVGMVAVLLVIAVVLVLVLVVHCVPVVSWVPSKFRKALAPTVSPDGELQAITTLESALLAY